MDAFASINGTVTFMTFDSYSDFYDTFIDPHPDVRLLLLPFLIKGLICRAI